MDRSFRNGEAKWLQTVRALNFHGILAIIGAQTLLKSALKSYLD
jgi:hypothetical protein